MLEVSCQSPLTVKYDFFHSLNTNNNYALNEGSCLLYIEDEKVEEMRRLLKK